MNTPIPHRISEVRTTFNDLKTELSKATLSGEAKQLIENVEKQLSGLDNQLAMDRQEESERGGGHSASPTFFDTTK